MRPILRRVLLTAAIAACFFGRGLVFGGEPAPLKPYAFFSGPGLDGKPVMVLLVPGPSGNWALVVGNSSIWQLTPIGEPVPPGPPPPTPPTPPPVPPTPPPAPTPAEAAKQLAIDAAHKLPPGPELVQDAAKLAGVYRALAEQIPKTIDTLDKLIVANRYAREIALGPQRAVVWEPWIKELGLWLDAQRTAGAIKTVDDCKPVWTAIGDGLATVKGRR